MLLRRLAPLAALATLGVLSTACADQSAAIKVGDQTYSDSDFRDDLEAVAGNDTLIALHGAIAEEAGGQFPEETDGATGSTSYSQQFVSFMLGERLRAMILGEVVDRQGIEVSDEARDSLRGDVEAFFEQEGGDVSDVPDRYLDGLVDSIATSQALQSAAQSGDLDEEAIGELEERLLGSIEINSRYGSFDKDEIVLLPPAAPLVQGDDADAEPQLLPG